MTHTMICKDGSRAVMTPVSRREAASMLKVKPSDIPDAPSKGTRYANASNRWMVYRTDADWKNAREYQLFTDADEARRFFDSMDAPLPSPETVARAFARLMRDTLTKENFAEMVRRNDLPEYAGDICASHDLIDANEVMFEAFASVYPALKLADDLEEAHLSIWKRAWTLAKAANFNPENI